MFWEKKKEQLSPTLKFLCKQAGKIVALELKNEQLIKELEIANLTIKQLNEHISQLKAEASMKF